jgi:hypothetical protein
MPIPSGSASATVCTRNFPRRTAMDAVNVALSIFCENAPQPSAPVNAHLKFSGESFGAKPMCAFGP